MRSVPDARKEYEQRKFLKLTPLDRMKLMHGIMSEIIGLRARAESVSEHEVYTRYLRDNPRHYQKLPG
ncbi:MAG: hypothetical protein EHM23_00620 [Acidobacteria bacterium]|nr:MAG: hypothetical protein EHM23_00620 [Acidobacteriota bacterium]